VSRWLDADAAAAYLCLRPEAFMRRVRAGLIPPGSAALGGRSARWSTDTLDALMAGSKVASGAQAYVERLEAEAGARRSAKTG